jgi:hypothetical protein
MNQNKTVLKCFIAVMVYLLKIMIKIFQFKVFKILLILLLILVLRKQIMGISIRVIDKVITAHNQIT